VVIIIVIPPTIYVNTLAENIASGIIDIGYDFGVDLPNDVTVNIATVELKSDEVDVFAIFDSYNEDDHV
jgi:hypothetical protein